MTIVYTETYPDAVAEIDVKVLKGLTPKQLETIKALIAEESEEFIGAPYVFDLGESLKEWLYENNEKTGVSLMFTLTFTQISTLSL